MSNATIETVQDVHDWVGDEEWSGAVRALTARVHARGDTIVYYRNEEFGHPDFGQIQVCSWGSAACQLAASQFPEIPTTLPDIGGRINWRYQLVLVDAPKE